MHINEGHRRNGHGTLLGGTEQCYEVEPKPFDFICPALPGRKENMHLQSCLDRLQRARLDVDCKNCETGRYNRVRYLSGVKFKPDEIVRLCKCGNPVGKRCKVCAECQAKTTAKGRQRFNEKRAAARKEKKRQKLLAKQDEINKQIAEIG
jgi:hypothetical protein